MTAKIRIIPDTLSNKIAAGEVVQRPASVVKELVENSIDAGADEITIEVVKAGKGLIRVSDNGTGMSKDDALLSIERFATSKIKDESDLFNIRTLGFRGEALPSIASVSRFTITTKREGEVEGTSLYLEGGRLKSVRSAGVPKGTTVEVKNLFYNTPARKKFMKSNKTELFHISDTVVKIAASLHDRHIKLISDDRVIADFTKTGSQYNRICDFFAADVYKYLLKIDEIGDDIRIFGFASSPVYTANNAKKFFTYVNGRYIFDKIVNFAIRNAYKEKIEERKYPAIVLFIEMPPDEVDVNVHPTKKDVRFADQNKIIGYIESAVKNALKSADITGIGGIDEKGDASEDIITYEKIEIKDDSDVEDIKRSMREYLDSPAYKRDTGRIKESAHEKKIEKRVNYAYEERYTGYDKAPQSEMFSDYIKVLGQVGASFVICTKGDSLLLIDQHAAHERILFDGLRKRYEEKNVTPQPLLIPIVIEVSKTDSLMLEGCLEELNSIGFLIEHFGKNSYAVKEVPDILIGYDYKEIIHDLIADLMFLERSGDITDKVTGLMKLLSCKGAIKANRRLTDLEIIRLLTDMADTEFSTNCPHGRPVAIELTSKDIKKMFKRL